MVCIACAAPASHRVCPACAATLRPAPDRILPSGLRVVAGHSHEGAARVLVHRLKYGPVLGVGEYLAGTVADRVIGVDALVPVPRARLRRWRSGIDPAAELAAALGRLLGIPVVHALAAPLWWPRHAGQPRAGRTPIGFHSRLGLSGAVAIVDDVVTTGATLESAANAIRGLPALAVAATSAGRMSIG